MGKSSKKYTKPVGKVKRRKKLQTSQNQYAQPTSFQVTSTQQNISEDPEKAAQMLEMENMTQRQRLKAQRQAQKEKIQAAKDARVGEFEDAAGQGLEYLGEAAKEKAKKKAEEEAAKKVAEEAAKKTAETAAAVVPNAVIPTTSAATSGVSSASAQTLATQGSGMSQAYGNQLLSQEILNEGAKTTATTAGKTAATSAGKAGFMGTQSAAVTPIALGANLTGTALKTFGGDDDDTTYNTAEISGGLLQKAGEFGGYGAMLGTVVPGLGNVAGGIIGGVVGLGVGGAQMLNRKKKARKEKSEQDARDAERDLQYGLAQQDLFRQAYGTSGFDKGYNIGQSVGNSYLGGYQMAQGGGKKVPGGKILPLPGGAVEFRGNKHGQSGLGSDSGIILEKSTADKQGTEVEDKETMDKIKFADGNTDDYIFSSYLKLGGKSFAQRHKDILNKGGSQKQIQELAKLQEEKAKAVKKTPVGPTNQYGPRGKEYIARYGGVKPRRKAQTSIPMPNTTQQTDALGGFGLTESQVLGQIKPVDRPLPSNVQRQLDPRLEQQAQESMATFERSAEMYDRMSGNDPSKQQYSDILDAADAGAIQPGVSTDPNVIAAQNAAATEAANQAPSAGATGTQPAPTQTPTTPGAEYEDALVTQDGVQFSTEKFKREGKGPTSIDYSGNINASSWEDVLNTNWAENIIGDRDVNSQEDLKKIYNKEYVPQVESFFETNPEQAYDAIVNFALSGNPNASNLKKKIFKDGKMVSDEEVLRIGLKNATDGKVGTFHSLFTGQSEDKADMATIDKIPAKEIPTEEINKELKIKQPEEVEDADMRLKPPKVRDIPPLAYLGAAAQALGPAFALATKYDQPERVSPGMQGPERLARVNYNAERAANLNATTSANRYIQNVASGPAAVALTMASNNNARNQSLQIANAEARENTQLKNAEASLNARITQGNIANDLQAQGLNAQAQNVRDQLEYEKKVSAMSALGNIGGQFASDALQYKAVNRQARANQIAGEFTRQEFTESLSKRPKYRKMLKKAGIDPNDTRALRAIAANMYDPTKTEAELDQMVLDYAMANKKEVEEDDKKYGGRKYVKRSGKVKRKTRK